MTGQGHGASGRELLAVGAAAGAYLAASFFRDGVLIWQLSPQEGGVWLDEAVRTLRGERIYRDFFDFIAPGNVLLIAAVLAVAGATPAVVGGIIVGTGAALAVLFHAMAARMLPRTWRWPASALLVVYLFQPYSPLNHKWTSLAFVLAGILFIARARDTGRCVAAGAMLAAATLTTQDMGVGATLGLAVALALLAPREGPAPLARFLGAYVATLALLLAILAAWSGAGKVAYDIAIFPLTRYGNVVRLFTIEWDGAHAAARTFAIFGLVAVGVVAAAVAIARSAWREAPPVLLLVAGAGIGLFLASISRPIEPLSLGMRTAPLLLFALAVLHAMTAGGRARWFVPVFLAATVVPTAAVQLVHAQWLRPLERGMHPAGGIWEPRAMSELRWLEKTSPPGTPVFLFPYIGGHEFLTRTRNVSSFPMIVDMQFNTPEQVLEAAGEIARKCPPAGLWNHKALADPVESSSLRPLYAAIRLDYDSRGEVSHGIEAFTRKPSSACMNEGTK